MPATDRKRLIGTQSFGRIDVRFRGPQGFAPGEMKARRSHRQPPRWENRASTKSGAVKSAGSVPVVRALLRAFESGVAVGSTCCG